MSGLNFLNESFNNNNAKSPTSLIPVAFHLPCNMQEVFHIQWD